MKGKVHLTITAVMALVVLILMGAAVQAQYPTGTSTTTPSSKQEKPTARRHGSSIAMSKMMQEPHHVLAMAYKDNLTKFTKALDAQARRGGALNTEFAQAAVAEIRRSFDQMELHLQDHMKAMGTQVGMPMSRTPERMETHLAPVRQHLGELEQEIQLATPDPKKVAEHTAEILKHLNTVSAMHRHGKGGMKM